MCAAEFTDHLWGKNQYWLSVSVALILILNIFSITSLVEQRTIDDSDNGIFGSEINLDALISYFSERKLLPEASAVVSADCTALGGVDVGGECHIQANSFKDKNDVGDAVFDIGEKLVIESSFFIDAAKRGATATSNIGGITIKVTGDFVMQSGSKIFCNDKMQVGNPDIVAPGQLADNAPACPISIEVSGKMDMTGAQILAENNVSGGSAANVSIKVTGGDLTVGDMTTGSKISSSKNAAGGSGITGIIDIDVTNGNLVMENSSILADCVGATCSGGTITIDAFGNVTLKSNSLISSSHPSAGTANGGNITINAGGDIEIQFGSTVKANSINGLAGKIVMISGDLKEIIIDGQVLSQNDVGRGGPITIDASCNLTVGEVAIVSSKGKDPGAERVHLEGGCDVFIDGLVESTGPGHTGGTPTCKGGVGTERPDKPATAAACVEIWAGKSLTINGEINADYAQSGGATGASWIDLFSTGKIEINGGTGSTYDCINTVTPFAVHANGCIGGSRGGNITAKSEKNMVVALDKAIQANGISNGGKGGKIIVEAFDDVDLSSATLEAKGSAGGAAGIGGIVMVRSFNNDIEDDLFSVIDVSNTGNNGTVELTACGAIGFPPGTVTGDPSGAMKTTGTCGGMPTFESYVTLPECGCDDGDGECKWCNKSAVLSQVRQNMGECCAMPDIIVDLRADTFDDSADDNDCTTVDPNKIGTDQPATCSLQAAVDYFNDNPGYVPITPGQLFIGVTAKDCTSIVGPSCESAQGNPARPPGGEGTENVVIMNTRSERLNVFGCSVTLNAADPDLPVITIRDGNGKVTVLDIHVVGSHVVGYFVENNDDLVVVKNGRAIGGSGIGVDINDDDVQITGSPEISNNDIGIRVNGNNNVLRTNNEIIENGIGIQINGDSNESNGNDVGEEDNGNGVGIEVTGDMNDLHDDDVIYNIGDGIIVSGNSNEIKGEDVENNGGDGIKVTGNMNILEDNRQVKFNGGDGIEVSGDENLLDGNTPEKNSGHGINADSAIGATDNDLEKNQGKNNTLQGIRACGQNDLGDNTGSGNGVIPQVDFVCPAPGSEKFFVADDTDNRIYTYDASGNPAGSFTLAGANSGASGVAVVGAGTDVYVLDKGGKKVYKYSTTGTLLGTSKVLKESGGGSLSVPSGLAIDGDDMWVVDDSKKKIYKYSLASAFSGSGNLNAAQQISFSTGIGNNSAEGLAIDATSLYVLDDEDKKFYKYPRAGGAGVASKVLKKCSGVGCPASPQDPSQPSGSTFDGTSIFIVDKSKDRLHGYDLASLFSGSGNLNASFESVLLTENDDPRGL